MYEYKLNWMEEVCLAYPTKGLILEASPLPKLPVQALLQVARPQPSFSVVLAPQSQEEKLVNGGSSEIVAESSEERYPLVVMLDGIVSELLYLRPYNAPFRRFLIHSY